MVFVSSSEKLDMKARLSELSDKVTEIEDANDLPEAINGSLIQLSSQLLNLWGIFLQSSLESKAEKQQIKEEKFKKLFFSTDHPREEAILYDEKIAQRHKEIYEEVKKSPKVSCSLECLDTDIVSKSAPVIFEDRYLEPDAIDCSEDVKSSPVACTKDPRKKLKSLRTIMATDGNLDLSASFHDMPYTLRKGLFEAKKELREWISRFFSNNRSKKFTLSMELVNDSDEGISVQIRMRPSYCNYLFTISSPVGNINITYILP
ncbi:protein FAM135A-like [Xenopus laevis]|uniref:Protein FAM135A-like n=2 Tax=Xenopus laevis TaxID=8355 RepID=A0A8J1M5A5_XENLA|nr:protein FAM135A-like isoform X1 [Xenopus laevis]XP_041436486.1 protein FAM135A-like [Xenopus laevis]